MITIKCKDHSVQCFAKEKGMDRLDFGISSCGYVTVYRGNHCLYKKSLREVKNITVATPDGTIIAYKHWRNGG